MMRPTGLFLGMLMSLGVATTGCDSDADTQPHAEESFFRIRLAGGDLVAPILFEASTGMSVTPMGPLIFSSHYDEDVLSQDGNHRLRAFNCQSPERKAGTYQGEESSPLSCDFHLTSTTPPFEGQSMPEGGELRWVASLDAYGTFELLAYEKDGLKHAKVGPKASTGASDTQEVFDLQAEFKLAE